MIKRLKECRNCKKYYTWIKGIQYLDQGCCSTECFMKAGPKQPYTNINLQIPNLKKSQKQKNKEFKKYKKHYNKDFYQSQEWLELRYDVIEKYGRLCMACGTTVGSMHVDHIIPQSLRPDLQLDFNNLQILCKECNLGKSNRSTKDFRNNI